MHFEQRLATIVASHGGYRYESGTHSILNPTSIIEPPLHFGSHCTPTPHLFNPHMSSYVLHVARCVTTLRLFVKSSIFRTHDHKTWQIYLIIHNLIFDNIYFLTNLLIQLLLIAGYCYCNIFIMRG